MPDSTDQDNRLSIEPVSGDHMRVLVGKVIQALEEPQETVISPTPEAISPSVDPPWTLQQFFNGEINLDVELANRFRNMPVMSTINFRALGNRTGRGVATIAAQDGAAQVIFDADRTTRVVHLSFTFGSMLTLHFRLQHLNDVDRARWVALMRRETGGLAFLWGPSRWENDYVICVSRKYFTNLFAFSPNNFEAAVRMTPEVTRKLIDWLDDFWKQDEDPPEDDSPQLLTW